MWGGRERGNVPRSDKRAMGRGGDRTTERWEESVTWEGACAGASTAGRSVGGRARVQDAVTEHHARAPSFLFEEVWRREEGSESSKRRGRKGGGLGWGSTRVAGVAHTVLADTRERVGEGLVCGKHRQHTAEQRAES
eukprot:1697610-Rhodomonas_salina.4